MPKSSATPQLLNRLRMRQVALMLAIEEYRTLRAAAQYMGITQPAASVVACKSIRLDRR